MTLSRTSKGRVYIFTTWDVLYYQKYSKMIVDSETEVKGNDDVRIFLMPMNWQDLHWGLLGYDKFIDEFFWFESFGGKQNWSISDEDVKTLIGLLKGVDDSLQFRENRKPFFLNFPDQKDSWSCGLRVCYLVMLISQMKKDALLGQLKWQCSTENRKMKKDLFEHILKTENWVPGSSRKAKHSTEISFL